jgi:hypothetical protein
MNLKQPAPLVQIATDGQGRAACAWSRHCNFSPGSCLGAAMMMPVAAMSPTLKLLLDTPVSGLAASTRPATSPPPSPLPQKAQSESWLARQRRTASPAAAPWPCYAAVLTQRWAPGEQRRALICHPTSSTWQHYTAAAAPAQQEPTQGLGRLRHHPQRSSAAGSSSADYPASSKRCRRACSCAQPTLLGGQPEDHHQPAGGAMALMAGTPRPPVRGSRADLQGLRPARDTRAGRARQATRARDAASLGARTAERGRSGAGRPSRAELGYR